MHDNGTGLQQESGIYFQQLTVKETENAERIDGRNFLKKDRKL